MKTTPPDESLVPFERVAKFIRQLTHDVRNGLSALDLEGAYIAELVTDPEVADEVRKLRSVVANTARSLREISQNFQPVTVHPVPWKATVFVEELGVRLRKEFPEETAAGAVAVESRLREETIDLDFEQGIEAILSVVRNAFQFGGERARVAILAFAQGEEVVMEAREPKTDFQSQVPPEEWGVAPLITTRSGGYGLGLFRTRRIFEAHGGKFGTQYIDGVLITRMSVPVWRDSGA